MNSLLFFISLLKSASKNLTKTWPFSGSTSIALPFFCTSPFPHLPFLPKPFLGQLVQIYTAIRRSHLVDFSFYFTSAFIVRTLPFLPFDSSSLRFCGFPFKNVLCLIYLVNFTNEIFQVGSLFWSVFLSKTNISK